MREAAITYKLVREELWEMGRIQPGTTQASACYESLIRNIRRFPRSDEAKEALAHLHTVRSINECLRVGSRLLQTEKVELARMWSFHNVSASNRVLVALHRVEDTK